MRGLRIAPAVALAASLAIPLGGCATTTSHIVSAKVAGSAESAYQAFVVAEQKLLATGKIDRDTFRAHEQKAYDALLLVRAGQLSVDAFTAQLATLTNGG